MPSYIISYFITYFLTYFYRILNCNKLKDLLIRLEVTSSYLPTNFITNVSFLSNYVYR